MESGGVRGSSQAGCFHGCMVWCPALDRGVIAATGSDTVVAWRTPRGGVGPGPWALRGSGRNSVLDSAPVRWLWNAASMRGHGWARRDKQYDNIMAVCAGSPESLNLPDDESRELRHRWNVESWIACLLAIAKLRRLRYLHWHVFVFPSTFIGPAGPPARLLQRAY